MWFNINYNQLALLLLPTFLRKPVIVAYIQSLLVPIDKLYYKWSVFRVDNLYRIKHTGQVFSLRKSLNDRFDPVQRRIYITDGNFYDTTYIYTEAEGQDVWLYTEAEAGTLYLRTEPETADTGLDFIVWVPQQVYTSEIYGLKAHIDFYRAGGKRYNIFIHE
jgi:hypothetical protein